MRKLSKEEKAQNEMKRKTNRYIKGVKAFIENSNDGVIPIELECSIELLEVYYSLFLQMSNEIEKLPSLMTFVNNTQQVVHPLIHARDNVATKLDTIMKSLGITFKEQTKMKIINPVKPEANPLDEFIKKEVR